MESIAVLNHTLDQTTARHAVLTAWLSKVCATTDYQLHPMPGDASFRRYFRVAIEGRCLVLMDAPPDMPPPVANGQAFVAIANILRDMKLQTPEIFAADIEHGLVLMSDLGEETYLQALNNNPAQADSLYCRALEALAVLQQCRVVPNWPVPPFTAALMRQEWAWHKEWFLQKLLGVSLIEHEKALDDCFEQLILSATSQPQVFMHRDYQSANLMVLPHQQVGILDFQDAFIGPVTYDLVSLLRDCYLAWPEEKVNHWVNYYWQLLQADPAFNHVDQVTFMRWFDWMGIERHLKALFTFSRKQLRDHQPAYLAHIPRTLDYVISVSGRYPALSALHDYMRSVVRPEVSLCAQ
ncbi:MAG TPA: phosphotransferase [Gammaproteobacteria bacterium]|jgi:hypothetical protein|nr:phosphotransferase [Gammaproteobacteria bacterium]